MIQLDSKIKTLHSDHGGKYLDKEFILHLKKNDTNQKLTMTQLHRMALLNDKIALLLSKFMPYCMQVVSLDSSGARSLITLSS